MGHVVAMVGAGANGSKALAKADVRIAKGHGSGISMDVAHIPLISTDLIHSAGHHALRRTVLSILQNLFCAFIYNVPGFPIAVGVLYPINGFLLDGMIAGAASAVIC